MICKLCWYDVSGWYSWYITFLVWYGYVWFKAQSSNVYYLFSKIYEFSLGCDIIPKYYFTLLQEYLMISPKSCYFGLSYFGDM
jgi:hypothetical protein